MTEAQAQAQAQPQPVQFSTISTSTSAAFWALVGRRVLDEYGTGQVEVQLSALPLPSSSLPSSSLPSSDLPPSSPQLPLPSASQSTSGKIHRLAGVTTQLTSQRTFGSAADSSASASAISGRLSISLDASLPSSLPSLPSPSGTLQIFPLLSLLKSADKPALISLPASAIRTAIRTRSNPTLGNMCAFTILVYPDIKKHIYTHWFAVPAIAASPHSLWLLRASWQTAPPDILAAIREVDTRRTDETSLCFMFDRCLGTIMPLSASDFGSDSLTLVFRDTGVDALPSWTLRNVLAWLGFHAPLLCNSGLDVILLRPDPFDSLRAEVTNSAMGDAVKLGVDEACPVVGWQANSKGKMAPNQADLGSMMDPVRLADQAVGLNLKLMRWRILPDLDLERIAATKCLLLGAGTLGCHVARTLLAWGVKDITLLDSGNVSYSNPVRQPLFNFEDCFEGGKPKAECAAAALRTIYPGVNSKGIKMSIPMPGHPLSQSELQGTIEDTAKLTKLIEEADAIFLLMDSRESRWLPTLLGAQMNKIVINAALGFDSYMVMRHGHGPNVSERSRLGCYFCQDITAPADSLTDRTMDQMCTVTRPGLAAIAGATAVELLVSVRTNAAGNESAAATSSTEKISRASGSSPLGIVPHQIRGFLGAFSTTLMQGEAYGRCSACSEKVIDAYKADGFKFLERVFADPTYLERVSGLEELQLESEAIDWDEAGEDEDL